MPKRSTKLPAFDHNPVSGFGAGQERRVKRADLAPARIGSALPALEPALGFLAAAAGIGSNGTGAICAEVMK
jgi:hypothetical protein